MGAHRLGLEYDAVQETPGALSTSIAAPHRTDIAWRDGRTKNRNWIWQGNLAEGLKMGLVKGFLRGSAVAFACALIAGCGDVLSTIDGSGNSGSNKSTLSSTGPATGSVSGVAMNGQLVGSDVRVFNFDSGKKGEMLAAGLTDARGKYRIDLAVRSQPILVEISGGRYTEPASSRTIALDDGQALLAVQNYRSGNTLSISPTYYTTLAAGLAENLVRMGASAPQAVADANQRIPAIAGLKAGFDAVAATPLDISSPASVTPFVSSELEYGFVTTAPSSLTEAASITANRPVHETINSIAFTQLALDDVRHDGVLDGQGIQGVLAIGITPLTVDVYRNTLALNVLRMAANTEGNKTSITPTQLLPLAQRLNDSTDPIYGGRPIIPLNVNAPMIADLSIAPNALLAGSPTLTASVTSLVGVTAVELLIDNVVVGTAADPVNPSITFDTTTIADGSHQLSVRATDIVGGTTTTSALAVTITNAEGRIGNISLTDNSVVRGTIIITADIVDRPGIAEVRYIVDNLQPVVSTDPKASFRLDTVGLRLEDGPGHSLRIIATNTLGREIVSPTINFKVDNTAPTAVIISPTQNAPIRGPFDVVAILSDNLGLGDTAITMLLDPTRSTEGTVMQNSATQATLTQRIEGTSIPTDGVRSYVVIARDQAGNTVASAPVSVTIDNAPPVISINDARLADRMCRISGTIIDVSRISEASITSRGEPPTPLNIGPGGSFTIGALLPITITATDFLGNTSTSSIIPRAIPETDGFGDIFDAIRAIVCEIPPQLP